MNSSPALPKWIPEDDILLKNAVEAGASLESLAKGAVTFSRRYSLAELRERWSSLLYDPVVSLEASAAMAKLELAKSNGCGITEISGGDGAGGGRKRKARRADTICRKYYALRKRLCYEIFDSLDMSFNANMRIENNDGVVGIAGSHQIDDNLADTDVNIMHVNNNNNNNNLDVNSLVGCGNLSGLEKGAVGPSHSNSMSEVPLRKTIEDVSAPAMPVQVSLENENVSSSDKVDSLLLRSPGDTQCTPDASGVRESQLDVVANPLGRSHGDHGFVSDPQKEVQSSAAVQISLPEPGDGFMFCRLNTEDPDIPSNDIVNDAVNISTVVAHPVTLKSQSIVKEVGYPDLSISNQGRNESVTLKSQSIVKEVGYPDSYISNQRRNEPVGSLKKEDIPPHSVEASRTVRPGLLPNIISSNSPVGIVLRTENSARNSISAVNATTVHASDGCMKQEEVDAPASVNVYAHSNAKKHKALPDQGGGGDGDGAADDDDDDDDDYDDDDDDIDDTQTEIPYSSDAEAMILEMDLSPTDQDTNTSREVLKYQHEETKRTIMRLEQCALSCSHRGIASQGALAVLYGHKTKQYIKKSEVILGRATDDLHVDIDLSREGRANKISRRQASIKLEENGSFIIKNFGKRSIFVNGKEVPKGKLRGLRTNSLIQVRGLSFVFVVYDKCVRKFIEDVNE